MLRRRTEGSERSTRGLWSPEDSMHARCTCSDQRQNCMTLAASARRSTAAANAACVRRTCSSARAGARSPSRPTQTARSRCPGPACIDDGRFALVTIHAAPTASWVPIRVTSTPSATGRAHAGSGREARRDPRPRRVLRAEGCASAPGTHTQERSGSEKLQMERVRVDAGPAPRSVAVAAGGWGPSSPSESPIACGEFGGPST